MITLLLSTEKGDRMNKVLIIGGLFALLMISINSSTEAKQIFEIIGMIIECVGVIVGGIIRFFITLVEILL
jgi:hypothetical protein